MDTLDHVNDALSALAAEHGQDIDDDVLNDLTHHVADVPGIEPRPLWDNDLVQFARLLDEIRATQDGLDYGLLCGEMDLDLDEVSALFDRAEAVFEASKARL